MTVVIALVVVALFFALLTVERTALYGVLKAIGRPIAHALRRPRRAGGRGHARRRRDCRRRHVVLDSPIPPGSIPLYISAGRIVSSIVLLLVAAVIGCAFSLRRVLRVDPASALGSSQ